MIGLEIIERSNHATHIWLKDIGKELNCDKWQCYFALSAVLHGLRDNIPVDQSARLASQMPMIIRGIYYCDWDPNSSKNKVSSKEKFIERVRKSLNNVLPINIDETCEAVFRTLNHHLNSKELQEARASLTKSVQTLWPEPEEVIEEITTTSEKNSSDNENKS